MVRTPPLNLDPTLHLLFLNPSGHPRWCVFARATCVDASRCFDASALRCFEVISDDLVPMYLPGPDCPAFEGGTAFSYALRGDDDKPFPPADQYEAADGDNDADDTKADAQRSDAERCQAEARRRAERGLVVKEFSEHAMAVFDAGKRGIVPAYHVRFRPHAGVAARARTAWAVEWRRVRVIRPEWHLSGAARGVVGTRRCFRSYVVEHLDAPDGFETICSPELDSDADAVARIIALQGSRERGVHPCPHLPNYMTQAITFRAGDVVEVTGAV